MSGRPVAYELRELWNVATKDLPDIRENLHKALGHLRRGTDDNCAAAFGNDMYRGTRAKFEQLAEDFDRLLKDAGSRVELCEDALKEVVHNYVEADHRNAEELSDSALKALEGM